MFMVPRRPAGELLLLGFVSEARDLCLERACREMGLAPEYRDCVKPLLRLPESAYPRCCGGGCEPCAEALIRVARRTLELMDESAKAAP